MLAPAPGTLTVVDIRIGIVNSPRELAFESSESAADIAATITTSSTARPGANKFCAGATIPLANHPAMSHVLHMRRIGRACPES